MTIQIVRNVDGNCIEFRGSSKPTAFNNTLSGQVDSTFPDTINVVNTTASGAGEDIYEFYQMHYTAFVDSEGNPFPDAATCAAYITSLANIAFSEEVNLDLQGYYARLTNFYFTGGVATETSIESEAINTWITPNFVMEPTLGLFDNRPLPMKEQLADPFDVSTSSFSLEGLTTRASVVFRASMSFEPDEDGGQVDVRLLFDRHSGTTPADRFPIEDVALTMQQGADVDYPAEPSLTFFVGDTIDTNGPGDAGRCTFQVKTSVPGTVRMRAITWYITS